MPSGDECLRNFDDMFVDVDVFEDLEDHAIGRQCLAVAVGEEGVGHVDERSVRADKRVEADVAERGEKDLGGRRVRIAELYSGVGPGSKQQLVGDEM